MRKHSLPLLTILLYLITFAWRPAIGLTALSMTRQFLLEMLQIVPVVFVLTGLIAIWVPPTVILQHFGDNSGWRGRGLSLLIGAFSAGPIYAAFPFAQTLLQKGASLSNVVIVISAWAVIKVPLVLAETRFLGLQFALTRYLLSVPAVLCIGLLTESLVGKVAVSPAKTENPFPGINCGACGQSTCEELADLCAAGEATVDQCVILKNRQRKEKEASSAS